MEVIPGGLKVAVTVCADAPMFTVQVRFMPEQAPLQPPNPPVVTVAVKVTMLPLAKFALHVVGQLMPAGVLVTVPTPLPVTVTLSSSVITLEKVAVTV